MKRTLHLLFHITLAILLIPQLIQAETAFSIRLNGGWGKLFAGDLNTIIDSQNVLYEETADQLGLTKQGAFHTIDWGPNFEGELIYHLNDNLGFGFSTGYILRKKNSTITLKYESVYHNLTKFQPKISVVPLRLSGYYFQQVFSKTRLFVRCGLGIYFGTMNYSMDMDETILELNYIVKTTGEVNANGTGFHGGFGLEHALRKNIFIFIEGKGRYAELNNWRGQETFSGSGGARDVRSGALWYYESFDEELGKQYSNLRLSEDKPVGSNLQNVRKFSNNLSGVSFNAGIRIRF